MRYGWNRPEVVALPGSDVPCNFAERLRPGGGPTGQFPQGRIRPDDESEPRMVVDRADRQVVVRFGTPIAWLGMSPQ